MSSERQESNLLSKVTESVKSIGAAFKQGVTEAYRNEDGLLILTRKIDQGVVISGNIIVRVIGVERDRVKLGISAPPEITVLRAELVDFENLNKPPEPSH